MTSGTGAPKSDRRQDGAEQRRLACSPTSDAPWRQWGPYLSARQWGTVREDYSANGDAWGYFPFEQAHARAYRWGEDGLGGICDRNQHLCLAVALWNGADRVLKERLFGLTNAEGNHGEDAKEHWWVLDGTPTHSWMRWLYRYPQAAYPYDQLRRENARRGRDEREYKLADTGVLAGDRFFDVTVTYAKAAPDDIQMVIEATNHGPGPAPLHVLPQVWFRNTWSWHPDRARPELSTVNGGVRCRHPELGEYWLAADGDPPILVTGNDTNAVALFGAECNAAPYTKDGINEHVLYGAATIDPTGRGTKAAAWYRFDAVGPGETVRVRVRLSAARPGWTTFGPEYDEVLRCRAAEAEELYRDLLPDGLSPAERQVARRAYAGLLWTKKRYRYGVRQWLAGDPGQPAPPSDRRAGRNVRWRHFDAGAVLSLPDEWEYPWFAAWDLAFHTLPLAHVDPAFAKDQLVLLCREWLMHPDGQLPAYEWAFGDVNPPVHAWAALRVYRIDAARTGRPDRVFLARVFGKLLLNFSWWVNRKDPDGSNLFEGGFLGMDNISVFDRSTAVPAGRRLEQSDATSWMAAYCLAMLQIALELARHDPAYDDVATKFLEHFVAIGLAAQTFGSANATLWDERDGFCYDSLVSDQGAVPVRVRSMVGLVPLLACTMLEPDAIRAAPDFASRLGWLAAHRAEELARVMVRRADGAILLTLLDEPKLARVFQRLFDEGEFLSPYGIRSLSAAYRGGAKIEVDGGTLEIDYEPAESGTGLFGGNSNWRGPVWMPMNVLLSDALACYGSYFGPGWTVELPVGSGRRVSLTDAAADLERRLVALFLPGAGGRRPSDPRGTGDGPLWTDHPTFSEYFHGDTGEGLGASHQTGWTALVAALLMTRSGGT
ncbi:MAG TPA: glucosidase [Mycobacteriales bacterium]|nr:glucosidase [Mycobacteriales bacterium]